MSSLSARMTWALQIHTGLDGGVVLKHDEYLIQCSIVAALSKAGIPVFSVPNHLLKNGLAETKREYKAGFRKGAPDLIAGVDGKCYWLELKTDKGHQSIEQQAFQTIAPVFGAEYRVVRSMEDINDLLKRNNKSVL